MSTVLTPLTAQTEARIQDIGSAEILVGIPSYNNADTVGHVVRAVSVGLAKHFPGHRAVLVNSDGGSSDETPSIVARTAVDFQHLAQLRAVALVRWVDVALDEATLTQAEALDGIGRKKNVGQLRGKVRLG